MRHKIIYSLIIYTFCMIIAINTLAQNTTNTPIDKGPNNSALNNQNTDLLQQIQQNYETQNPTQNNPQTTAVTLGQVLLRTVLIVIVLLFIYIFIRYKLAANKKTSENRLFKVLYVEPIEKGIKLAILEFFGKYFIVSIGSSIDIVYELKTKEEIDYMKILKNRYSMQPKTFLEYLGLSAMQVGNVMKKNVFHTLKNRVNTLKRKEHDVKEDDADE